jgi:AraC family transcriptional regulator of adaptative response/methylated-DNA-[protein]-cysteine methyltransferase
MTPRAEGLIQPAPFVRRWDADRLRQRLVTPSMTARDSGSEVIEAITATPEVLPRDCRRGRALTPWGMSCLVWCASSVFQWEFDESSSGPRRGPWLDHPLPTDDVGAQEWVEQRLGILVAGVHDSGRRLSVSLIGTPFQQAVWRALLGVPRGSLTSYSRLAAAVGTPGAARAVGAACGANRVAVLVPCHRVIRDSGELSGYRWGMDRKLRLLAGELVGNEPE